MTPLHFTDFVSALIWLVAGFVFLHIISTAISNRILDRQKWRAFQFDLEKTKDTGPK